MSNPIPTKVIGGHAADRARAGRLSRPPAAGPRHDFDHDLRWSPRRTLAFIVTTNLGAWWLIISGAQSLASSL